VYVARYGWNRRGGSGTYPFLGKLKPKDFAKLLAAAEITLGSALMLPFVPSIVAGAGLAAFTGGLLGLYAKTPGMRKPGTPFPSDQGTGEVLHAHVMPTPGR
jgi:hypothetical protein